MYSRVSILSQIEHSRGTFISRYLRFSLTIMAFNGNFHVYDLIFGRVFVFDIPVQTDLLTWAFVWGALHFLSPIVDDMPIKRTHCLLWCDAILSCHLDPTKE